MEESKFIGGIDVLCKEYVNGYCVNKLHPDKTVYLKIFIDNKEIGITEANLPMNNSINLGKEDGRCGFYFEFPPEICNSEISKVTVLPVNGLFPLSFIFENNTSSRNDYFNNLPRLLLDHAANNENLFIVNHIPKTAGTSLRSSFEKMFPATNSLFHYNNIWACSPEIWGWKFSESPTLSDEDIANLIINKPINLLFGHFGHNEKKGFDKFVYLFPLAKTIVFFRNPKDHICSLYSFACQNFGIALSFEEFIEQDYTKNYQTKALCGIKLSQLSFFGLVEYFTESINLLNSKYGLMLELEMLNMGCDRNNSGGYNYYDFGDKEVWENFEMNSQADFILYSEAKKLFFKEFENNKSI